MKIDLDELPNLSEKSLAFSKIRQEMKRRGYWKNKNRGVNIQELIKKATINAVNTNSDDFSEGI